ncbi:sigma-70 family RNA polymerase sigma factor [Radiobacillus deserti]|uniref:Sigma-70 family RNA polymerase sigma factor n=1 Tax=Radiobacillus deserti TaxID=2594883 RepID=A0A516KC46_9BACI|nr:sigma-70 family RNA polymerase sigma factor [Radiobacillus deserti]QDP38965.1 sigma-70 family RNA polymerase sigma factor [Radiobacillus deserti]
MKENVDKMYQAYFQDVHRFLLSLSQNHHTAEDLVQETFFRAYLYLESYTGENVKTWLFTVAYRVFIDDHRKQKRTVVKDQGFFQRVFDKKKSLDHTLVTKETIQEVIDILENLPEKHKHAVLLHDFHELTQKEAAQIMDIETSYFKVLLYRGRQAIRRRKADEGNE